MTSPSGLRNDGTGKFRYRNDQDRGRRRNPLNPDLRYEWTTQGSPVRSESTEYGAGSLNSLQSIDLSYFIPIHAIRVVLLLGWGR